MRLGLDLSGSQRQRVMQLNELGQICQYSLQRTMLVQYQRAHWHDQFIKKKHFKPRDWDFLFDSRFKNLKDNLTAR